MDRRRPDLHQIYRDYIACLNARDYDKLVTFVDQNVEHNGNRLRSRGYVQLIKDSYAKYPWLHFNIALLVVDQGQEIVSARLLLRGDQSEEEEMETDVEKENVFYQFRNGRITKVWSMLDGFEKADTPKS
jgi:predicted ester cyclase